MMAKQNQETINISWKPDKNSEIPLYNQIVSYFSSKILQGDWVAGQKIPPQREMSKRFEVNRSTVVEAMEELYAMGLLEGHSGSGTKITYDIWSSLMPFSTPNWETYINGGLFKSNISTVQCINQKEYESPVLRLNAGEMSPDLLPNTMIRNVFEKLSRRQVPLNYPDPRGLLCLREALCQYLQGKGIYVSPNQILITSGALQALQLISVCIVPPRSTIYVEEPSYLKSLRIFQSAGAMLEGVPMDQDGIMPWLINTKTNKTNSSILYSIPSFQNPTGNVMSESRREELLKFCQTYRLPIVEDDVFSDLWLDCPPPKPIKAKDNSGIVLYVGSCSKTFVPGLRVGWLVGPESVIDRLADIKMQHDYGTSTISQMVLAESISSEAYYLYLTELRSRLIVRRDYMLSLLNQYFQNIATWNKPQGSFFIYLKLKHKIQMDKLFNQALEENLLISPGSMYGFHETPSIRLSYAAASFSEMEEGISKLAKMISSHIEHSC